MLFPGDLNPAGAVRTEVKPIESSYNAYSRAHLMAGDPEAESYCQIRVLRMQAPSHCAVC